MTPPSFKGRLPIWRIGVGVRPTSNRACSDCGTTFQYFVHGPTPSRCKPCRKAKALERRRHTSHVVKLRKWGLTEESYEELDRGGCGVCGTADPGLAPSGLRQWHFDHDHRCTDCGGHAGCPACFRGLLCSPCNTGIGKFNDDPELLGRALDYLLLFPESPRTP